MKNCCKTAFQKLLGNSPYVCFYKYYQARSKIITLLTITTPPPPLHTHIKSIFCSIAWIATLLYSQQARKSTHCRNNALLRSMCVRVCVCLNISSYTQRERVWKNIVKFSALHKTTLKYTNAAKVTWLDDGKGGWGEGWDMLLHQPVKASTT